MRANINMGVVSGKHLTGIAVCLVMAILISALTVAALSQSGHAEGEITIEPVEGRGQSGLDYTFMATDSDDDEVEAKWASLFLLDNDETCTAATYLAAKEDRDVAILRASDPAQPTNDHTRTITNEDDGKKLCVHAIGVGGDTDAVQAFFGVTVEAPAAAAAASSAGAVAAGKNAGSGEVPGSVADAGPGDDLLIGSLFIGGVIASLSCAGIWLNHCKLHRTKQRTSA